METPRKYRKKGTTPVCAVQLNLEMAGFSYQKWGATQTCKAGDWVVDNDGDVYTVDRVSFASTYEKRSRGIYVKTGQVWASQVSRAGTVQTKEGLTHYSASAYLVSNDPDAVDTWAVEAAEFERMYEIAQE